ncbi:hypothetical protein K788_0006787 [Paraburkholderia caribensis MBA4]|uniref:Uncharacterized protein n=1 Tax=Paraburkholderia caribensis MBA4 TaxID=1323664 RepID=A0A0N7JTA1_9BURK|nr:hypothetical protein K788_0006787 [Paraburkholderia caribensis MBA4]
MTSKIDGWCSTKHTQKHHDAPPSNHQAPESLKPPAIR